MTKQTPEVIALEKNNTKPLLTILIPIYEEAESIEKVVRLIGAFVRIPHEMLLIYDFEGDSTLKELERLKPEFPSLRWKKNIYGNGVLNAIKTGFDSFTTDVIIFFSGDASDAPDMIVPLYEMVAAGCAIASGTRYTKGGHKYGGPVLQTYLSKLGNAGFQRMTGVTNYGR